MELLQAILSLVGALGLILVLFYYLRKFSKNSVQLGGKRLKIIDRVAVGRDSALAVVCVCGKLMLVGVSSQNVTKICDVNLTESEYISYSDGMAFSGILSNLTGFAARKSRNSRDSDNSVRTAEKTHDEEARDFFTGNPFDNFDKSEGEIPLETNDFASDETE